jgi:SecD/SecF fusion protein
LSALLTNGGDSAATKGNNLCDKIIAQGGGPVLGLFSPKDTVNGYFKRQEVRNCCQQIALCEIPLGKIDNNKGAKDKDVEAVELYAIKKQR